MTASGTPDTDTLPSERSFGVFFSVVFLAAAAYFYFTSVNRLLVYGSGLLSGLFLAAAILRPSLLRWLNVAWFRLGILLAKIVSPVVVGVIFFLILTPVGLLTRMFGRDELKLRLRPDANSYWADRTPAGPDPSTFKNQF